MRLKVLMCAILIAMFSGCFDKQDNVQIERDELGNPIMCMHNGEQIPCHHLDILGRLENK